jgi:hypothetical protein
MIDSWLVVDVINDGSCWLVIANYLLVIVNGSSLSAIVGH